MYITIIGLGPGHIDQLTLEAWRTLDQADEVYLRTARHPMVEQLPPNTTYHSFDDLYDTAEDFDALYATIVARVLELGKRPQGVYYAVPGHPFVAEQTTHGIIRQAAEQAIPVRIVEGLSFIEPTLAALKIDAINGLQIFDAIDIGMMHHPPINPDNPAIVGQVYSRMVASDLKLTMMNQYPDDYEVVLVHGAGTADVQLETLPLYAIDRSEHIAHLTSLYVPPMPELSSFEALMEIIAHLRAPEGCPWDQEQTHASSRPYMLEEMYEVLEAIDNDDSAALVEELGDVLFHIMFQAQIAVDDGEFYMRDMIRKNIEKMIRRHPHIWGDVDVDTPADVEKNWEAIKRTEQAQKQADGQTSRKSALDGIPMGLPALVRAYRLQEKAASVGFDWHEIEPVIAKIREEIDEIETADTPENQAKEFGDLLFALVNWIRWQKLDPESLLRETNTRFYQRFRYIETQAAQQDQRLEDMSLEAMDALWDEAKAQGL